VSLLLGQGIDRARGVEALRDCQQGGAGFAERYPRKVGRTELGEVHRRRMATTAHRARLLEAYRMMLNVQASHRALAFLRWISLLSVNEKLAPFSRQRTSLSSHVWESECARYLLRRFMIDECF
jgi:hypothetical protein